MAFFLFTSPADRCTWLRHKGHMFARCAHTAGRHSCHSLQRGPCSGKTPGRRQPQSAYSPPVASWAADGYKHPPADAGKQGNPNRGNTIKVSAANAVAVHHQLIGTVIGSGAGLAIRSSRQYAPTPASAPCDKAHSSTKRKKERSNNGIAPFFLLYYVLPKARLFSRAGGRTDGENPAPPDQRAAASNPGCVAGAGHSWGSPRR